MCWIKNDFFATPNTFQPVIQFIVQYGGDELNWVYSIKNCYKFLKTEVYVALSDQTPDKASQLSLFQFSLFNESTALGLINWVID